MLGTPRPSHRPMETNQRTTSPSTRDPERRGRAMARARVRGVAHESRPPLGHRPGLGRTHAQQLTARGTGCFPDKRPAPSNISDPLARESVHELSNREPSGGAEALLNCAYWYSPVRASIAAWVRVDTPSFCMMRARCVFAVAGEMVSR